VPPLRVPPLRQPSQRSGAGALLLGLLAVVAGACNASRDASSSSSARGVVKVGAPAPAYRIATLAGDSLIVGPSESAVLLNVWATWCASCKEEFALMDTLLKRHGPQGLRVVAVSVDVGSVEPVQRTIDQYAVTFEVAHDPAGEIERRFPALGVPASYLIDRDGRLHWRHVGVLPPSVDTVIAGLLASPAPVR
jgi:thiol-disulfide isomerase/thioredoxin